MNAEEQKAVACQIELIKDEKQKEINALKYDILTNYQPSIRGLLTKLEASEKERDWAQKALKRANERYDGAVKHYELLIKAYKSQIDTQKTSGET